MPFSRKLQQNRIAVGIVVNFGVEYPPGISKKSALELIIVSGGFKNFTSAKQFSSFIGLCPSINESGTSIRGYRGMSRIGDKNIRATLYMCSLAARVYNKACQELYERMLAAGKAKKVALVAVMNKLLKQVFGIVKSGEVHSPTLPVKA
jgi:transposase